MESESPWVALLDEDKEGYFFWQYGFDCWADQLALKCFVSVDTFWQEWEATAKKPTFILLTDLFPPGEEKERLQAFLAHECCQQAKVFMVTDLIPETNYSTYRELGAFDCLGYPATVNELRNYVLAFNQYALA